MFSFNAEKDIRNLSKSSQTIKEIIIHSRIMGNSSLKNSSLTGIQWESTGLACAILLVREPSGPKLSYCVMI